jgi:hypothetical protein
MTPTWSKPSSAWRTVMGECFWWGLMTMGVLLAHVRVTNPDEQTRRGLDR